jgi:hypothetical protein
MGNALSEITGRVLPEYIGQVLGELSHRGAWLDEPKYEAGIFIVNARLLSDGLQGFKRWLEGFAGGKNTLLVP